MSLKTEIARSVKRTKITRAPCRRGNGEAVPRAEKFGDLITADHKVLSDNCESRNNHRYAVVGAGLSHPMDPGISVPDQNFTRNPEKLAKVHLHWQFFGIRKSLWRTILESLHVNATQIGNKWDCRKSSAQSERRDICSIVAIRSGQRMVGGFHGMLYLSAKHSRLVVWWEDTIWKAVRNAL